MADQYDIQKREASVPSFDQGGTSVGGEIDIRVATARRYPRSITQYQQKAMSMACLNRTVAEGCYYNIPRGGKQLFGKTIRLAEIVASCFQNLALASRIVGEDDEFIYAEGAVWDLENNVKITKSVRRRITDKNGLKFNTDMIGVTANAATSIALRNAIFTAVPSALTEEIYQAVLKTAAGDAKTLIERRDAAIKYCKDHGVSEKKVMVAVGKPHGGADDIGLTELLALKGILTSIKDGEFTFDTAFPDTAPEGKSMGEGKKSFGKNGKGKKATKPEKPKAEEPPPVETAPEPEPVVEPEPEVDPDADEIAAIRKEWIEDDSDDPGDEGARRIMMDRRKVKAKKEAAADDDERDSL